MCRAVRHILAISVCFLPHYLCQVGNNFSAFYSGIIVLINQQGLDHHQDLHTKAQLVSYWITIQ